MVYIFVDFGGSERFWHQGNTDIQEWG